MKNSEQNSQYINALLEQIHPLRKEYKNKTCTEIEILQLRAKFQTAMVSYWRFT